MVDTSNSKFCGHWTSEDFREQYRLAREAPVDAESYRQLSYLTKRCLEFLLVVTQYIDEKDPTAEYDPVLKVGGFTVCLGNIQNLHYWGKLVIPGVRRIAEGAGVKFEFTVGGGGALPMPVLHFDWPDEDE